MIGSVVYLPRRDWRSSLLQLQVNNDTVIGSRIFSPRKAGVTIGSLICTALRLALVFTACGSLIGRSCSRRLGGSFSSL